LRNSKELLLKHSRLRGDLKEFLGEQLDLGARLGITQLNHSISVE